MYVKGKIKRTCKHANCSVSFEVYDYKIRNGEGAYCSRTCRAKQARLGHKHTEHSKKLMSVARLKNPTRLIREKNPRWKGGTVGYSGVHTWLIQNYGKADECEECGEKSTDKMFHWANVSGEYQRDRCDFKKMCVPCPKAFDVTPKLTKDEVACIHKKYSGGGTSHRKLASEYGISRGTIQIALKKTIS